MQHYFNQPTMSWPARFVTSATVVTIVCALNLRGISLAARASVVLATFSLAPFAVMLVLALPRSLAAPAAPPAPPGRGSGLEAAVSARRFRQQRGRPTRWGCPQPPPR